MFKFKTTLPLFIMLAICYTKQIIAMNESNTASNNPEHVEKMMLLDEHMKKMGAEQADVKHKITKDLHQLHELGQCPTLTSDDINKAMLKGGFDHHISANNTVVLEKDNRKYSLKFTAATSPLEATSNVVMTEKLSELTPGKYTCKYEIKNEHGYQGGFELALEK